MASLEDPSPATGTSDSVLSHDKMSSPCASERKKFRRFDPKTSPNHRAVPKDLLLAYNRERKVLHLRSCKSAAAGIHLDPNTLVISIDAVAYEGGKAAAALCFHPDSLWNVAIKLENATKDNAQLEMLCFALNLIYISKTNGPPLKAVYIRCTGTKFCLANTTNAPDQSESDRLAVGQWEQEADKDLLATLTEMLDEVAGVVDVCLWCVGADEIKPVTEMATAYIYKQHGRDWYKEKDVARDRFNVDPDWYLDTRSSDNMPNFEDITRVKLEDYTIVAPQHIAAQGPDRAIHWELEARASLCRVLESSLMASCHCSLLSVTVRRANREGREIRRDDMASSYLQSMELTSAREKIQRLVRGFIDQQRATRSRLSHGPEIPENGGGDLALFRKKAEELASYIAERVSSYAEGARLEIEGRRS